MRKSDFVGLSFLISSAIIFSGDLIARSILINTYKPEINDKVTINLITNDYTGRFVALLCLLTSIVFLLNNIKKG